MRLRTGLFIIVICMLGLCSSKRADAMASYNNGIDVVIVIDTSGSMNRTDSERISIEAAKLFIDMMEINGSRIGLVSFSDKLGTCMKVVDLNTLEDKERIKNAINQLQYNGDTDIGLALKVCLGYLKEAGDIENDQVILFFTDGKIDLPKQHTRSVKDSEKDTAAAIETAKVNYLPIYTIGLNTNGGVDVELIQKMADETNGRCYTVESADKLPGIFNEIFADFVNSNIINIGNYETDGVNQTNVDIEIPNASVMEANVIMLSSDKLKEVKLEAPDGEEMAIDGNKAILTKSSQYSMLKILNPSVGTFNVGIKGTKGCKVHVNMVFNYKLSLTAKAEMVVDDKNQSVINIEAYYETEGIELAEVNLYTNSKAIAGIIDPDGEKIQYPMEQKGNRFTTRVPVTKSGKYTVVVNAENESFYRESSPVELELVNQTRKTEDVVTVVPKAEVRDTGKENSLQTFLRILIIVLGVLVLAILIIYFIKSIKKKNAPYYGYLFYQALGNSSFGGNNGASYPLGYCKGRQSLGKIIPSSNAGGLDLSKIFLFPDTKTSSGIIIMNKSKLLMTSGYGATSLKKAVLANEGFVILSSNANTGNYKLKISYSINKGNNY